MLKIERDGEKKFVTIKPSSAAHHLLQQLHNAMTLRKLTDTTVMVPFSDIVEWKLDSRLMTFKVLSWFYNHGMMTPKVGGHITDTWKLLPAGEKVLKRLNDGETVVLDARWG